MNEKEAIERMKKVRDKNVHTFVDELTIVLNILENKDKEIQFYKDINKTEKDRHKKTEKSLKGQIAKKDKIINEMAKDLTTPIHGKEWIKKYYERKVENGN